MTADLNNGSATRCGGIVKHLETLVRHMEWLIELQRDADVQDAIGWVIAENARLRKAIEEVPMPECECDFDGGRHFEGCAVAIVNRWKRNALEGE